jgi:hypothetical protein
VQENSHTERKSFLSWQANRPRAFPQAIVPITGKNPNILLEKMPVWDDN